MKQPRFIRIPLLATRQVVLATLLVSSLVGMFFLLYRFSNVILILFFAIFLSTAIRPAVTWLYGRGLPRSTGIILLYLIGFSLIILLVIAVLPMFIEQITEFSRNLPDIYTQIHSGLLASRSRLLQELALYLPAQFGQGGPNETDIGEAVDQVSQTLPVMDSLFGNLLAVFAVFILAFYWTLENDRMFQYFLYWIPPQKREHTREIIFAIEEKVGLFLLGQGILCLLVGIVAGISYKLIGLPYALVLGILAGLTEAIPLVGPALGAVPAILVALSFDPLRAVWVLVISILIQALENFFLVPWVMKQSVKVSPFVILLFLTIFSSLLGLPGAILAIPIAAIAQVLINRFVLTDSIEAPPGRGRLSLLRYKTQILAQDVRKQSRERGREPGPSEEILENLEATTFYLDQLLVSLERKEMEE